MTTKKKIILTILLAVLVGVLIYSIVYDILLIRANLNEIKIYKWFNGNNGYQDYKNTIWNNYIIPYLIFLIPLIVSLIYFSIKIFIVWTNRLPQYIINIKYSYQEYKEQKEQKRQIKVEQKKQKLLDKLSKM